MTKTAALLVLSLVLLGSAAASLVLMIPYGIAEPGQPHGWGADALLWSLGECAWTWWVFARRKFQPTINPRYRAQALGLIGTFLALGALAGLRLQTRNAWEASVWTSAILTTVGCRIGRLRLLAGVPRPSAAG